MAEVGLASSLQQMKKLSFGPARIFQSTSVLTLALAERGGCQGDLGFLKASAVSVTEQCVLMRT